MSDSEFLKRFQVVVLKSAYENLADPRAQDFFMRMCQLKVAGYGKEYPQGVLPFDVSDFVANHIMLCEKTSAGLSPVMGFKSVSLATCDYHRITFPILGMVKSEDNTTAHTQYFEELLQHARVSNTSTRLAYNGSYTVHPNARADKEFHANLWPLTWYIIGSHYIEEQIEQVVAVCATRFKVDQKKLEHGWTYITHHGQTLESYRSIGLHEAGLIPMVLNNPAFACRKDTRAFPGLWENRLVMDLAGDVAKKKAA